MTKGSQMLVAAAVFAAMMARGYEYDLVDNLKLPSGRTVTRRMVVGYRGECAEEPGNTKRAVEFSVSRGFPVAVDALTTADGVLIAAADPAFAARKWTDDLEKFDAGTLAVETWPNKFRDCGYRLAKFEEVVAAAKGPLVVRIADGKAATAEAVRRFKDVEIVDAVEPIDDPVKAVAAFEGGATRIFSTGPAKLFTQIEGLLARERVMKTDFRAKLVAHAGGRECAPENTLPAFKNMQAGGFSVEADFHLSKDGVVFLTHEHWMNHPKSCIHDRMANELSWAGELENADAGWWIGEKWKGTKFCTMDELFDTITPDRTLVLHIATSGPEIIEKIKEGFARHPSISPKNAVFFADARTVHKILPDYVVGGCPLPRKGWMQHDVPNPVMDWATKWDKGPADAFTGPRWDNELISRQYVETLHRKGVTVCVWSIDDPYLALAALDRGVDLVESDRPESLYREMTGEQAPKPIKYNGIALDGVPDEDRWRDAKWHDDFTRLKIHRDKGAFARKTEFAVWATSVDLYVAARCYVDDVEEMKKRPETDMWCADNFEVFLSPSGAEAAYYHFAVSPNSKTPMAEYFEEAGHIQPDFYMPRWEAKTAWETNAWTCEMQIPLTAFYWTRQADWKTEWRVNFCRTMQKPYELATWSPLEKIFHEPGAFRLMEGMPYRCRGWDGCIRKATATILERRADGSLRGEMDVDCHIPFDRACRVTSDCGSSELRDFKAGDHHIRFPCAFKKGGRIRTNFKLEYKGGNVAAERDYPVWVEYRPIDLRLTKPAYRGNFYPGQCADEVAGEVEILGGGEATVTLEGPGFPARSAKIAGKGAFAFDTKGFEKGEARLTVRTAKDEKTVKVRNLPKSAHRMTWIADGNLVVDGKPVLRRNMYSGTYMMGRKFIELYTADAPNFHATSACDRFVGIEPGHLAPGLERTEAIFDNPPSAKVYAKLDEIIAKNRDSDFCAYYICDEPECRGISPVYLKHIYDYVADKDPYHVINSATRGGKTYIDCLDWAETHPYINARNTPEGRKYDRPFSEIGRFIDDFDAAGRPDKCIGFLPTCFAYRWQTLESDYPTFDEYLVHTWAAVVRGAKTIWPYAAHDLGDRPQLHEGTRYLFSSFEALEDLILFGARRTLRKDKSAEVALWTRGDDALLVALNFTDRPQTVTFEGASGSFREFRGTRTFDFPIEQSNNPNNRTISLQPLETLVLTVKRHDVGLAPKAEVVAAIDRAEAERKSRDNQLLRRYAQLKVRDNLRSNFGGGLYKLFDGTRQMIARWAQGSLENWMEIEFRDGLKPVFDRVVVHGCGLIGRMEVSVPDGDGWRKVAVKNRVNEEYRAEVELAERVAPSKMRLDFPGEKNQVNRLEIYEVELPGGGSAAEWIRPNAESSAEANVAVFRRTVDVKKDLKRAEWRVTALGAFEAKVNGTVVSRFLDPGFTQPEKTRYEVAYDVTAQLKRGENALEAAVAPTWWRCRMTRRAYPKVGPPNPPNAALRATLRLEYADGSREEIATDGSWLSAYTGPVTDAGIYDGERYDARKGVAGLAASVPCDDFKGEVQPRRGPPILLREDLVLKPVSAYVWQGVKDAKGTNEFGKVIVRRRFDTWEAVDLKPGETLVVDFGQNSSAVPRFEAEGAAGTELAVKMCEMLNDSNGERARRCDGPAGSAMLANLRSARADIRYVLREGRQAYRPRFTFFGYRYASIAATAPVRIVSLESVPVTSIAAEKESPMMVTGNDKVNRLIANVRWGFRSNYLEIPTDCPQRDERLGWTADTMAFASAAEYSADVRDFLWKWLKDLRDCQGDDGTFPILAPLVWAFHGYGAVTGWSDAGVIVPHRLWKRYGERAPLEEHWPAMTRYMDFIAAHHGPDKQDYGDWQAFEHSFVSPGDVCLQSPDRYRECFRGFFFVWDAQAMKEMAHDLGKADEERRYAALERQAREEFAAKYIGPDGMMDPYYRGQTTDLFLLKLGLVTGAAAEKVKAHLVADIAAHGGCLQTGFLGTMILMETLSDAGLSRTAYDLLFQEKCPSWLFSVNNGATTIWERWDCYDPAKGFQDPGMTSFNHYSYGAVYAWMMSTVAGIREDPSSPGMRHFILAPVPDRRLGFAKAAYDAPCGRIESEWRYEGEKFVWRFRIPEGATATVRVPGSPDREYGAGEWKIAE